MQSKKVKIIALILSVTILSSLFLLSRDTIIVSSPVESVTSESVPFKGSISAQVILLSNQTYKGEKLQYILQINVTDTPILLKSFRLRIIYEIRTGTQEVSVNQTLQPGTHNLEFEMDLIFDVSGMVILNYGIYKLDTVNIRYIQRNEEKTKLFDINKGLEVKRWPIIDQAVLNPWSKNLENVTVDQSIQSGIQFSITAQQSSGKAILSTFVNTTNYPILKIEINGLTDSFVLGKLGDYQFLATNGSNIFSIGNINGVTSLEITASINNFENITILLSIPTQRIPIFVVTANNNWDGTSGEDVNFEEPNFYIKQASQRFIGVFNISFIEVKKVDFIASRTSNLYTLIDNATSAVGKSMLLDDNEWKRGVGPQIENRGADVLLIFTNRTMDHLGIVIGNGTSYNMAVQARGSTFEGNFRISSNLADNLLQHEISHILGAPDRWTYKDDPSIMTKSRPEDGFRDIASGNFWLLQTQWLDEDIITMIIRSKIFS